MPRCSPAYSVTVARSSRPATNERWRTPSTRIDGPRLRIIGIPANGTSSRRIGARRVLDVAGVGRDAAAQARVGRAGDGLPQRGRWGMRRRLLLRRDRATRVRGSASPAPPPGRGGGAAAAHRHAERRGARERLAGDDRRHEVHARAVDAQQARELGMRRPRRRRSSCRPASRPRSASSAGGSGVSWKLTKFSPARKPGGAVGPLEELVALAEDPPRAEVARRADVVVGALHVARAHDRVVDLGRLGERPVVRRLVDLRAGDGAAGIGARRAVLADADDRAAGELVAPDGELLVGARQAPPADEVDGEAQEREVRPADRPRLVGAGADRDDALAILAAQVRQAVVEVDPAAVVVALVAEVERRQLERGRRRRRRAPSTSRRPRGRPRAWTPR